jgi:hypothetical protein
MTCLEIENGQLREIFRKANLHALDLADRIKRLEEAGDRITQAHCPFLFIEWTAAKESKP